MIPVKNKKCISCGREDQPWFSKKRCKQCASKDYKIPKISPKKRIEKKEQSDIRDVYFTYHISKCRKSEESGVPIYEPNRTNICHILPKRTYKSVQGHFDNYIYLTLDEHTRFDKLLDEMEFDKLKKEFPSAIIILYLRFKKLIPFVTETDGKLFNNLKTYFKL
jgi:hypothetical protein